MSKKKSLHIPLGDVIFETVYGPCSNYQAIMVSFGKFYVKIDVCHQNEDMYEVGFLKHVGFREILAKM